MYTTFYGLNEEPFRLTPDPRFLHLAEPHREVLTSLVGGVLQRKGILVTTGPIGTGKTTRLHATLYFVSSQSGGVPGLSTAFVTNPALSRDELLEAILDEFEITCTSSSKPRRLAALHEMLLGIQRSGGTSVLVVDEAHLLTMELLEEIRLLTNTDLHNEKLLQVILAGQPELLPVLRRPELRALKQRVANWSQLRPLTTAETRVYIGERLHSAGLRTEIPISSPALDAIHNSAQGVPRLINLLCDKCLWLGFSAKKKQIGAEIVQRAATLLEINTSGPEEALVEPAGVGMSRSTLDLLIESLKRDRSAAR